MRGRNPARLTPFLHYGSLAADLFQNWTAAAALTDSASVASTVPNTWALTRSKTTRQRWLIRLVAFRECTWRRCDGGMAFSP
jgi:hypothetical protein